jgi:hypothetical protein
MNCVKFYIDHVQQAQLGADFDIFQGGSGEIVTKDLHQAITKFEFRLFKTIIYETIYRHLYCCSNGSM